MTAGLKGAQLSGDIGASPTQPQHRKLTQLRSGARCVLGGFKAKAGEGGGENKRKKNDLFVPSTQP